jgi:hypothetical protein
MVLDRIVIAQDHEVRIEGVPELLFENILVEDDIINEACVLKGLLDQCLVMTGTRF